MANPNHSYFVPIRFRGADKSYNFSTEFADLKLGDLVVVDSVSGYTMGFVAGPSKPLSEYHSTLELKPVLRKPTKSDMLNHTYNLKEEKRTLEIVNEEIQKLGLPMDLLDAVYTLDGTYVTITYTTPEKRVDFRELLHQINPLLGCRVELRQIAPRDRAKMTGGLGICGLPLCCSSFLSSFDSISIGKAKNQMLTLNIPKLSGHCGKLICCLAYEDDYYTEAKKEFPKYGTVIHLNEGDYTVDAINILSKTVRLTNAARDDYKTYELEDIVAIQNGTYKERVTISKIKEDELPSFGIVNERKEEEPRNKKDQRQNNQQNQNNNRPNNKHHNNRPQQQNNNQNNRKDQNQRRDQNQQNRNQGQQNNRPHNNQNRPQNNNRPQQQNSQNPQQNQDGQKRNNNHRFHRNHHYHGNNNKPKNEGNQ